MVQVVLQEIPDKMCLRKWGRPTVSEGPAEFPPGVGSSWGEPVSLLKHRSSSDAPDARGQIHGLVKFFQGRAALGYAPVWGEVGCESRALTWYQLGELTSTLNKMWCRLFKNISFCLRPSASYYELNTNSQLIK